MGNGVDYLTIRDAIATKIMGTGRFLSLINHEWRSAPSDIGVVGALINNGMVPVTSSGLSSTSMRLELLLRILLNGQADPQDLIDVEQAGAADAVWSALLADTKLGGVAGVRCIDVYGMDGEPMRTQVGWVDIGQTQYRLYDLYIPILINDSYDLG